MDDRLPLSVLLLVRDETREIEALLPALTFAREIVVVWDARGAVATREAAARLGASVSVRALDGFGPQRQFALERCHEPWVLWIDADERLDAAALASLRRRASAPVPESGYTLERRSYFLGRRIRYCGWQGESVLRVFRRDRAAFDDAPVHERVRVEGAVGRLAGTLEHHSYERWEDCLRKLETYARAGAEKARAAGRRAGPLDLVLRPPLRFLRMYVAQLGFLDGVHGFVLCSLAAAQVFLKYAALWADGPARGAAGRR